MKTHPLGTKAYLTLALMLCLGQRRSDVVVLGRQHVKDCTKSGPQHRGAQDIESSQKVVRKVGPELHRTGTPHGRQGLS